MSMAVASRKPAMTASQARAFVGYSMANAVHVESALACGCKAYEDVFTYARWQAQGFQVRRGERSIHIPVVVESMEEDKETGEVSTRRLLRTGHVFCRHQVEQQVGERE